MKNGCMSTHLHQMLIYPFCKGFLLHSVSFICKKKKLKKNTKLRKHFLMFSGGEQQAWPTLFAIFHAMGT